MRKIRLKKEHVFWCNECDLKKVNSTDPFSGTFFIQYGHTLDEVGEPEGDYMGIVFALCPDCSPEVCR